MAESTVAATLTPHQARCLHLAAQGVRVPPRRRARRAELLAAVVRMQLLQIDTIHVVARSPYLVLHARIGDYPTVWLEELLARGQLFETWAHEACFAPIADYPLHHVNVTAISDHWALRHARRMVRAHRGEMQDLLRHVRELGAVKAADFERRDGARGGGWWGWKSEKRWLEAWFALGELMIARRENFQRVYDLRERVLARARLPRDSAWTREALVARERFPTPESVHRSFTLRAAKALGVAQARWLADYFRCGRKAKDEELDPLVASGELLRVAVRGWDRPGYVHADHAELLRRAAAGRLAARHATVLSPFDPVVWDRARAAVLFGFDYRIECYTPAEKRRYGYFSLPILVGARLVGRLDAKAHRDDGVFEVRSLHLEDDVVPDTTLAAEVARAILASARWQDVPRITLGRVVPRGFATPLRRALKAAE